MHAFILLCALAKPAHGFDLAWGAWAEEDRPIHWMLDHGPGLAGISADE